MNHAPQGLYIRQDISEWDLFSSAHTDYLARLLVNPPPDVDGVCFVVHSAREHAACYALYVPVPESHSAVVDTQLVYHQLLSALKSMTQQLPGAGVALH